jgi:hypothetical protein
MFNMDDQEYTPALVGQVSENERFLFLVGGFSGEGMSSAYLATRVLVQSMLELPLTMPLPDTWRADRTPVPIDNSIGYSDTDEEGGESYSSSSCSEFYDDDDKGKEEAEVYVADL